MRRIFPLAVLAALGLGLSACSPGGDVQALRDKTDALEKKVETLETRLTTLENTLEAMKQVLEEKGGAVPESAPAKAAKKSLPPVKKK